MRGKIVIYGWVLAAFGAAIWLLAALLVAYPKHFLVDGSLMKFSPVAEDFLGEDWHERLFLPLLISVDLIIDVMIHAVFNKEKLYQMGRRLAVPALLVFIGYPIFCLLIPNNNPDMTPESKNLFTFLSLITLFIVRWISLVPHFHFPAATGSVSGEGE